LRALARVFVASLVGLACASDSSQSMPRSMREPRPLPVAPLSADACSEFCAWPEREIPCRTRLDELGNFTEAVRRSLEPAFRKALATASVPQADECACVEFTFSGSGLPPTVRVHRAASLELARAATSAIRSASPLPASPECLAEAPLRLSVQIRSPSSR
jgi:hypothetical protein